MRIILTSIAITLLAGSASAQTTALAQFQANSPAWRGGANASFSGWYRQGNLLQSGGPGATSFTVPFGAPGNLSATGSGAVFTQTGDNTAIVSGSGSLYCTGIGAFTVAQTVAADLNFLAIQIDTFGSHVIPTGLRLSYALSGGGTVSDVVPLQVIEVAPLGDPLGGGQYLYGSWDLSGESGTVLSYTVSFAASDTSTAVKNIEVDAHLVPTPGALALGALGMAGLGRRRRR